MEALLRDLRYAVRQFRRSPAFFAVACLLIAMGIAANTQIFAFADALLFRLLPLRDPQNLVQLFEIRPRLPAYPYFDYPFFKVLAARSTTLFKAVGHMELTLALDRGSGPAERVHPHCVTGNYFSDLGVEPLLGRVLREGDENVAVLSYAYWSSSFGRDPGVLGRTVRLQGHPFQVVGITREGFTGTVVDSGADLWIPYQSMLEFSGSPHPSLDNYVLEITARLRPGVLRAQSEQETAALWTRYMADDAAMHPQNHAGRIDGRLEVRSTANGLSPLRDQSRTALVLMLAGAGLLLMLVSANVGGLLLARASAREKETAVRLAMGASRGSIAIQRFTESLLLAVIGGTVGIAAAYAGIPFVAHWLPPARGIGEDPAELRSLTLDLRPDSRVIAFSIAICALAAIFSALAPIWRASREDLTLALKTSISDRRHARFQALLCGLQVALCTLLLTGAGLMLRTFSNLRDVNTGFDASRVAIFSIDPHVRGYDGDQTWQFQRRLLESARLLPGVESAAIANRALMRGIGLVSWIVFPGQQGDGLPNTSTMSVSPDYFEVMGMHLLAGRELTEADRSEPDKVMRVVVNEAFVHKFLAGRDPLGKQFAAGRSFVQPEYEIIGVVNDTNYRSLRETPPPILYSYQFGPNSYPNTFELHLRAHGDPKQLFAPVRALLQSIDPQVPVYERETLSEEVDRSLWQERLLASLASGFGVFAMALTAAGLYGILGHFVSRRRREIGLRMALGAEPRCVIWLVARRALPALVGGIVAGAAISRLAGRWVRSLLYGVQPFDTETAVLALALLLALGLAAAVLPALRAIRLDPASTLREE